VEEITRLTPGFISRRQEWPCCCGDACEFHGDSACGQPATSAGQRVEWEPEEEWVEFFSTHDPGPTLSICLFICRHCKQPIRVPNSDETY